MEKVPTSQRCLKVAIVVVVALVLFYAALFSIASHVAHGMAHSKNRHHESFDVVLIQINHTQIIHDTTTDDKAVTQKESPDAPKTVHVLKSRRSKIRQKSLQNGPVPFERLKKELQEEYLTYTAWHTVYFIKEAHLGKPSYHNIPKLLHPYIGYNYSNDQTIWKPGILDVVANFVQERKNLSDLSVYTGAAQMMITSFDQINVESKQETSILVGGSISPWMEGILIGLGFNNLLTTDYNLAKCSDPRITLISMDDLMLRSDATFDIIVSYSSIEHDGLGRYGDPLNPWGDLAAMEEFYNVLKADGYLILSVPFGMMDALYFNQHRQFGPNRFKVLTQNWNIIGFISPYDPEVYHEISGNKTEEVEEVFRIVRIRNRGDYVAVLTPKPLAEIGGVYTTPHS